MKKLLLLLGLIVTLTSVPAAVYAAEPFNPLDSACQNANIKGDVKNASACQAKGNKNPLTGTGGVLNNIATGVAIVTGAIAIVFVIIGGYKMMLSSGDPQAFTSGRNTVIYAAVGLIVIVLAKSIISFVLNKIYP